MVLSRMDLFLESAHARLVLPHDNEEIFRVKSDGFVFVYDFNMRQPLSVGTHFVLTFHDENAVVLENAVGFTPSLEV